MPEKQEDFPVLFEHYTMSTRLSVAMKQEYKHAKHAEKQHHQS